MSKVATTPIEMIFIGISRCVRGKRSILASPLLFISLTANPTAPLMIPHDLMIPITPAVAIPPIPM